MFDVKAVIDEAQAEINEELGKAAKGRIKDSLRKIAGAERILANLRIEHDALLRDIGAGVVGE